jgi:hypothetical protein
MLLKAPERMTAPGESVVVGSGEIVVVDGRGKEEDIVGRVARDVVAGGDAEVVGGGAAVDGKSEEQDLNFHHFLSIVSHSQDHTCSHLAFQTSVQACGSSTSAIELSNASNLHPMDFAMLSIIFESKK